MKRGKEGSRCFPVNYRNKGFYRCRPVITDRFNLYIKTSFVTDASVFNIVAVYFDTEIVTGK